MALVSGRGSTLNPNATPFIPAVHRQVEDFWSEGDKLMPNSGWFHEYNRQSEHRQSMSSSESSKNNNNNNPNNKDDDIINLLPDTFDLGYEDEQRSSYVDVESDVFAKPFGSYGNNGLFRTERRTQEVPLFDAAGFLMKHSNMYSMSSNPNGRNIMSNFEPPRYNEMARYINQLR